MAPLDGGLLPYKPSQTSNLCKKDKNSISDLKFTQNDLLKRDTTKQFSKFIQYVAML